MLLLKLYDNIMFQKEFIRNSVVVENEWLDAFERSLTAKRNEENCERNSCIKYLRDLLKSEQN